MHFAAWLSVGDSVKDPIGYYRNNVGGALSVLEAMVATGVEKLVFSSTAAVFGNPGTDADTEDHPTRPINAYGETKLAVERALPHFERAYGLRSVALRYFNAAGADPDGDLGEDHDPEMHVIPRAIDAAAGRGGFQMFGEDYDDAGWHLPSRLRPRHGPCRRARSGARMPHAVGAARPSTTSATASRHRCVRCSTPCERVTGKSVPYSKGPRRAGRSRPCSSRRATASNASLAGGRATRTSTPSSKRPGGGAKRIPPGYRATAGA